LRLLLALYRIYAFLLRNLPGCYMRMKSNGVAFLILRILRYRKKVILDNLRRAFPELCERDYRNIHRVFVRNFSDVFHEIIRYSGFSREKLLRTIVYTNPDLVRDLSAQGKNTMILAGHFANWELLGLTLPLVTGCKTFAAARKQADPLFNDIINALRQKHGLEILVSQNLYRSLLKQHQHPFSVFLLADQSPARHEVEQYLTFLGQDTPVYTGPERIARAMGMTVIFAEMTRTARGHYSVTFKTISGSPDSLEPFEITRRYNELMESMIRRQPESWLWSHRRWKHSRQDV